ncbi:MAG: DUF1343 domain-containing protein [Saprospiraceae bacterium]|nr:DUF1343 domain-containing protein [Saprospiraceae bacterium]
MRFALISLLLIFVSCGSDQSRTSGIPVIPVNNTISTGITPGAAQLPLYVPKLEGLRCGVVVNQSSVIEEVHLIDTLRQLEINVVKIFVPEHGFRGEADAGAEIRDGVDVETGLPIRSLYGRNKKPSPEDLRNIDIMLFDLQDVGVRCYTYASTLHYVMEACAEQSINLIVLDRPNPNAHYVDGPVLEEEYRSFIGMHPVPFVYGMTIGEYAKMIKGEDWIKEAKNLDLTVIPCHNYDHTKPYSPKIPPSPNLRTPQAILLYPSLVFFEGTIVSVGRGTPHPFEIYGHPDFQEMSYVFTPESMKGAAHPKLEGIRCHGEYLGDIDPHIMRSWSAIQLSYLMEAYELSDNTEDFFLPNLFFDKLAGSDKLRKMIISGRSEEEIRNSWENELEAFRDVRKNYLLYDDQL